MMKRLFLISILIIFLTGCKLKPNTSYTTKGVYTYKESVELVRVVDGDTIVVIYNNEEKKVRLIGINCEESVAGEEYLQKTNQEITERGISASEWLKDYLNDVSYVELEFDEQLEDNYNRILAYVYVEDRMLNEELLINGYADIMTIPPNTKHQKKFERILEEYKYGKNSCYR